MHGKGNRYLISGDTKPCSFLRFFINRLPAVILATVIGLGFLTFMFLLLDLLGVVLAIRGPNFVDMGLALLCISGFGVFTDRIFLLVAQPNNPYKFSNEFRYFLKMPTGFSFRRDDLPLYWKLILIEEGRVQYELQTPIDKVSRLKGEAPDSEGLSLLLTFTTPKEDQGEWHAVVERLWKEPSYKILPERFIVPWFSPTVLSEVEKFFVQQGLIDFLIDEKGRRIDFTWNSYVVQEPAD